jgi:hypothetical protein
MDHNAKTKIVFQEFGGMLNQLIPLTLHFGLCMFLLLEGSVQLSRFLSLVREKLRQDTEMWVKYNKVY